MPKFPTGRQAPARAGGSSGAFTPFLTVKENEPVFVQFLGGVDDIMWLPIHKFVKVPVGDDGESYRHFACRKSEAWADENPDNECVLCDEMGHKPTYGGALGIVLLEPTFKGNSKRNSDITSLSVKTNTSKDGEREFPEYQVAHQSDKLFWTPLKTIDIEKFPINDHPFKVIRQGSRTDTSYSFLEVTHIDSPDLSEYNFPDLGQFLGELGSEARLEEYRLIGSKQKFLPQAKWSYIGAKDDDEEDEKKAKKTEDYKEPSLRDRVKKLRDKEPEPEGVAPY